MRWRFLLVTHGSVAQRVNRLEGGGGGFAVLVNGSAAFAMRWRHQQQPIFVTN